MNSQSFPNDQSTVIFTDLQGVRRRGIYLEAQVFKEVSEMEVPRDQEYFFAWKI